MSCDRCHELEEQVTALKAEVARLKRRSAPTPQGMAREAGRQDARDSDLRDRARNSGREWTERELALVARTDLTVAEVARMTGRTYDGTREKRRQLLRGVPESRARRRQARGTGKSL